MRLLLAVVLLTCACYGTEPEVRTSFLAAKDAFVAPDLVGPIPDRFNVWARSVDETVAAFRISVHYEHDGQRVILSKVIPNDAEHGAVASFVVPDVSIKVLAVNVGELKQFRSVEVPVR